MYHLLLHSIRSFTKASIQAWLPVFCMSIPAHEWPFPYSLSQYFIAAPHDERYTCYHFHLETTAAVIFLHVSISNVAGIQMRDNFRQSPLCFFHLAPSVTFSHLFAHAISFIHHRATWIITTVTQSKEQWSSYQWRKFDKDIHGRTKRITTSITYNCGFLVRFRFLYWGLIRISTPFKRLFRIGPGPLALFWIRSRAYTAYGLHLPYSSQCFCTHDQTNDNRSHDGDNTCNIISQSSFGGNFHAATVIWFACSVHDSGISLNCIDELHSIMSSSQLLPTEFIASAENTTVSFSDEQCGQTFASKIFIPESARVTYAANKAEQWAGGWRDGKLFQQWQQSLPTEPISVSSRNSEYHFSNSTGIIRQWGSQMHHREL